MKKGIVIKGAAMAIVENNTIAGTDVAIEVESEEVIVKNNRIFANLLEKSFSELPILRDMSEEHTLEVIEIAKQSTEKSLQGKISDSSVGTWLRAQKFTDWATLCATLIQLGILTGA